MRRSALVVVALLVAGCGDDDDSASTSATTTTETGASLEDAIVSWVDERRAEVFTGFDGAYAGPCEDGMLDVLCSIDREDLGEWAIQGVGVAASDWGADVLLEQADGGWSVVDEWAWDLDSDELGPPFSPLTAIAEWWSDTDPAATFVRDCASVDPSSTDQRLVCADLMGSDDDTRTYRTGAPPDVHEFEITVRLQSDHTWIVL